MKTVTLWHIMFECLWWRLLFLSSSCRCVLMNAPASPAVPLTTLGATRQRAAIHY